MRMHSQNNMPDHKAQEMLNQCGIAVEEGGEQQETAEYSAASSIGDNGDNVILAAKTTDPGNTTQLMPTDYKLVENLVTAEYSFVIADARAPDNPIVFVSQVSTILYIVLSFMSARMAHRASVI
jgi:hypothetical protein